MKTTLAALVALLVLFCSGAMATVVFDSSTNAANVGAGGLAGLTQAGTSTIAASGNVEVDNLNTADVVSGGPADVSQNNNIGVTKANDVSITAINAASMASSGGKLTQGNAVSTNNRGDADILAMNSASQFGNGNFKDTQGNTISGYGAQTNNMIASNDLLAITCGNSKVNALQFNTKAVDPCVINFYDGNDATIVSGTVGLVQKNNDYMGATHLILGTSENNANVMAWKSSDVDQSNNGFFMSPGNVGIGFSNTVQDYSGKNADVDQTNAITVNTHPWGPSNPTQIIALGKTNIANVHAGHNVTLDQHSSSTVL